MTSSTPAPPSPEHPTVRLRSPGDLVVLIPYLLGFHPDRSVVVAAVRGDRVVFAARGDLPDPGAPPAARLAEELLTVTLRQRPDELALLGYGAAPEVDGPLRAVAACAERHTLPVRELLRVHQGRWWSYRCERPECCPPEGTPFDPRSSEVAARCAAAGLVAAPSRSERAAALTPVGGAARAAMAGAVDRAERALSATLAGLPWAQWPPTIHRRGRAAVRAAIDRYAAGGVLDDDELAELGILLVSVPVRDTAWRAVTAPEPHLRLWTDATRRLPAELVAAPASLLGFTAWRAGDGALARIAVDRALDADPFYSMAALVREGLRNGLPPSALEGWPGPVPPEQATP